MTDFLHSIFRDLSEYLISTFTEWGWSFSMATLIKNIINFIFIGCISALSWYIARVIITKVFKEIANKTENKYDDKFVDHKVFEPLSQIFPAFYIQYLIQFAVSDADWVEIIRNLCKAWNILSLLIIFYRALDALLDITNDILAQRQRKTNVKGYFQVVKIVLGIAGGIGVLSVFTDNDPLKLFGGMAGVSAILMLVFKDTISGFVASIQLTSLNMVKMNDWITMASRHIQGNVVEITLNTIKVRNFDNSVVTVPTASLMNESFINWSNMQEMEARRMERTIMIDADTIKIASPELIEKIKKQIPMLAEYIEERQKAAADKTGNYQVWEKMEITNLELFRKYIEFYIKANYQVFKKYKPTIISDEKGNTREIYQVENREDFLKIHGEGAVQHLIEYKGRTIIKDLESFLKEFKTSLIQDKKDKKVYYPTENVKNTTYINDRAKSFTSKRRILVKDGMFVENGHLMIRQMQQTSTGVPLEVYCFTKVTEWAAFERMQSAFFEHLYAIIKDFELRTFQFASSDVRGAVLS